MEFFRRLIQIFLEIFLTFLSALVILLGYPIIFVILLLCWIYKQLVLFLVRKDPKIGKRLEGIDAVLASHDPYTDPTIVLIPYYSLADKLDISTVVKVLQEKVILPNIYPEFAQRIVQKYGYHFWYTVDHFKVENHVRNLQPDKPNMPITRAQLRNLLTNEFGKLPFDSAKSPWEILVVQNMIDERDTEVKHRSNHGNFLAERIQKKPNKETSAILQTCKFAMLFFLGPYHLLKMFVFSRDHHKFVENTYKSDFEETFNSQCTPAIPGIRLKSVKMFYGVSMSTLITTLFGHATLKSMRMAGIPVSSTLHAMISFPLPGHEDHLTNHWSLVRIPIKVNEYDPIQTLKQVEYEYRNLRNSVKPLVFLYSNQMIGLIPLWLRLNLKSITPTSLVITNFPGPTEPSEIIGCRAKQISLGGKPSRGISFICGCFSLSGNFWLDTGSPICNLPDQKVADKLSESIMDTLEYLERGIQPN